MSLVVGRWILFGLMAVSFVLLGQPSFVRKGTSANTLQRLKLVGVIFLSVTFFWAFFLGSLMAMTQAVLRG